MLLIAVGRYHCQPLDGHQAARTKNPGGSRGVGSCLRRVNGILHYPCGGFSMHHLTSPSARLLRNKFTRRQFTRTVTGAALGVFAAPAFLRGSNLNDKLNMAIIAAGGRGGANLGGVASENIVALCDVNESEPGSGGPAIPTGAERSRLSARSSIDRRISTRSWSAPVSTRMHWPRCWRSSTRSTSTARNR